MGEYGHPLRACVPQRAAYGPEFTYLTFSFVSEIQECKRILILLILLTAHSFTQVTASVVLWSEFLATDLEVTGSIAGTTKYSEK
jgi:hypothetical protein